MHILGKLLLVFLTVTLPPVAMSQEQDFNQKVADSDPWRTEQARDLDEYIRKIAADSSRMAELFKPDYSSIQAFEKSAEPLRNAFCDSIGYPPPGERPAGAAAFTRIGEDAIGVYYRAVIPILPGVHSEGIYMFNGGANYHDMVRGAAKRGYVVYAPQHLFQAAGYPQNIRQQIDDRMRLIGTSLTAVEIAKITYAIDELVKRPEVDAERIAMVGLSYGGYYAQVTPAIDTRIKVSVSSCYFGVQEGRYEADEMSVPSDFRFMHRITLFNDADLVSLICPRAHQIQAGATDNASHREKGKTLAPRAAVFFEKLNLSDHFQHIVFEGGHEFDDESAWAFVEKHL